MNVFAKLTALGTKVVFSIDMSLGIFIYSVITVLFGKEINGFVLAFAIFCVFLPDADMIPFVLLKKAGVTFKRSSHWVVGHHPVLVIPLVAIGAWILARFLWPESMMYIIVLAVTEVFVHFMHDSTQLQGLHWFSPFSWTHYSFAHVKLERVPDEYTRLFYRNQANRSRLYSGQDEFESRADEIGTVEFTLFGVAIATFVIATVISIRT